MNTRGIEGLDIRGFVRMMRRLFRTREVFLRELVQNSLEALHQAERHGSTEAGEVRVESGGNSTVVVRDNGIGMTREQLLTDLTVLFKSGWPSEGGESLGIGEFGFGFYSVFLVADRVSVRSCSRLDPGRSHTMTVSGDDSGVLLSVDEYPHPPGTTVTVYLGPDTRYLQDDDLIRKELLTTYLYSPYRIKVNSTLLGVQTVEGWARQLQANTPQADMGEWFQSRYGWDEPPVAVHSISGAARGWLVACPEGADVPPVDIYRRGVFVARQELIPSPLNNVVCGLIDSDHVNLRPDRSSLCDDDASRLLSAELESECGTMLTRMAERHDGSFDALLAANRRPLTEALVRDAELREAIGPYLSLPLYQSGQMVRLRDLVSRTSRVVWLADGTAQRVLADRAYHLDQRPIVVPQVAEQKVVQSICLMLGAQFVSAEQAYVDDMRVRIADAPRSRKVFQEVVPGECEILCAKDQDERFPIKVLTLDNAMDQSPGGLNPIQSLFYSFIARLCGENRSTVLVINAAHPMIQRFEEKSGEPDRQEISLAKLLYFVARISCGIDVPIEESAHVYDVLTMTC